MNKFCGAEKMLRENGEVSAAVWALILRGLEIWFTLFGVDLFVLVEVLSFVNVCWQEFGVIAECAVQGCGEVSSIAAVLKWSRWSIKFCCDW